MSFTLINHRNEKTKTFESRSTAEEKRGEMQGLGVSPEDLEIVQGAIGDYSEYADELDGVGNQSASKGMGDADTEDGGAEPEVVETADDPTTDQLPDEGPSVSEDPLAELGEELGTDPLSILPGHMVDSIQGQPAVNKRGYAMIAERYNISVSAEVVEFPWENEESRCVARATATTDDGREYSGYGTACAEDGDMSDQIIELAETRSLKRSVSWASGVGIVSYQELSEELE